MSKYKETKSIFNEEKNKAILIQVILKAND